MADYRCTVEGTYGGEISWSFGMNITSAQATAGLATTWSNAWAAAWTDATHGLEVLYPATTEITGYRIALLDANYHETQAELVTAAAPGTATDTQLPYQNSILVSMRALPQIGRHARGRFYLPAPTENTQSANTWKQSTLDRVAGAVRAVQLAIQADGSTIFVVQKPKPKAVPPVPAGPKYVITKLEVPDKPARQSKRVKKVKPNYTSAP